MEIKPITRNIGAEIEGLDLHEPLCDEDVCALNDALLSHMVLFLRDQEISPEEHKRFASYFGRLEPHPLPFIPSIDGHPEVMVVETNEVIPPYLNKWHYDVTFAKAPPMGGVLLAREVPPSGGDTLWSNMCAAYDALSEPLQKMCSELAAVHAATITYPGLDSSDFPPVQHPVIRTHPVTKRRAIFVDQGYTSHIANLHPRESDAILSLLRTHAALPDFQVRIRWTKNSIAVFDNRCTQHYAVADYYPARRVLHRVSMAGEPPV